MKDHWGLCPQTPGIYRFRVESKGAREAEDRPILLPTPGMALGSVPTVALSSTQVIKI